MSHFSVLVIGENIESQLQPFHEFECTGTDDQFVQDIDETEEKRKEYDESEEKEQMSFRDYICSYNGKPALLHCQEKTENHKYGYALIGPDGEVQKVIDRTNPNSKWDWWVVGGRYSGRLKLKSSGENENQAKKVDVDFEGMRKDREEWSAKKFDDAASVISGRTFKTLEKCREENTSIEDARKAYHAQEVIKDFREKFGPFENIEEFNTTREEFISSHANQSFTSFAVVKDGKWYEKGSMGWFGCVGGEKDSWQDEFNKLVEGLSDDTLLTYVDCHI